jgi:hypothetical protein
MMRAVSFEIDDTEWAYRGVAHYSVRKGDKGDHETPAIGDAVDSVWVMRLDAFGVVGGERIEWHSTGDAPACEGHWKRKLMASRLLMERLEELCEADLARGSDAN